ncbi:MAG: hypothetical protein V7L00_21195 [Nostoc sp.]|uniref:hypothetical protein n=1 Tax=unclassified Nostoc TaxID=2593658 RepID=UPI0025F54C78|nr:hypothetical protein [Nostoc sp. JL33]MBN3874077.1 hypothetical protein [Nostoc sp. JL33]
MKLSKLFKILCFTAAFAISSPSALLIQQNKALAGTGTSTLNTGELLSPGDYLISPNQQYIAELQSDGDFILYDSSNNTILWESGTFDTEVNNIVMQYDCNLVIYDSNALPTWATFTTPGSNCSLQVQDDGNLVIYRGDNVPVWAKGTRLRD